MPQFSFYFLHWCAYNKTYKHKAEKSSLGRVFNQSLTYERKIQRLRAAHVSQNQGCGYIKFFIKVARVMCQPTQSAISRREKLTLID